MPVKAHEEGNPYRHMSFHALPPSWASGEFSTILRNPLDLRFGASMSACMLGWTVDGESSRSVCPWRSTAPYVELNRFIHPTSSGPSPGSVLHSFDQLPQVFRTVDMTFSGSVGAPR